MIVYTKIIKK